MQPHRRQPTRLCCPWNSPGRNTGVGCHFLLLCKSREVYIFPLLGSLWEFSPFFGILCHQWYLDCTYSTPALACICSWLNTWWFYLSVQTSYAFLHFLIEPCLRIYKVKYIGYYYQFFFFNLCLLYIAVKMLCWFNCVQLWDIPSKFCLAQ